MNMKSIILSGIIGCLFSLSTTAQLSGPISIEKKGFRKIYMQDGKSLDSRQLTSVLKSDPASKREYTISKTNSIIGVSSIGVGTIFIGMGFAYTLKAAQATSENDLAASTDYSNASAGAMLIGAGFYVVSLPFLIMSNSHFKKSVNSYNSSRVTSKTDRIDLNICFTGTGAAVQLRF
jgi:hypothetical protein